MNLFLVYGASFLDNDQQLSSWNYSSAIAGFIIPAFFITQKAYNYLVYSLVSVVLYLAFYFLYSPLDFSTLLVHGGLLILLSALATPIIVNTKYHNNKKKFQFRLELEVLNQKLENANTKLKESNATKDKLFSIIAHDLRSPFNALLSMNEIVSDEIDNNSLESAKYILSKFQDTSQRTFILLEDLLHWSGIQTGNLKFNPTNLDLKNKIDNVLKLLKANYSQKEINMYVDLEPTLQVYADRFMLETVIRNLVSNAIKFTNRGGTIKILGIKSGEEVMVSVTDNGVGIPENRIDQIFAVESNITTLGTEDEMGTGLGLVICREFIELHGGRIWVESEENEWTRFTFTLKQ